MLHTSFSAQCEYAPKLVVSERMRVSRSILPLNMSADEEYTHLPIWGYDEMEKKSVSMFPKSASYDDPCDAAFRRYATHGFSTHVRRRRCLARHRRILNMTCEHRAFRACLYMLHLVTGLFETYG